MLTEDPWHIGELPGDDGRTIRDSNGLTVKVCVTPELAQVDVDEHNDDDETCRDCGAQYPQAGDGWDGLCPACADKKAIEEDVDGEAP